MIDIDFLPADYRQRSMRNSNRLIPAVVMGTLVATLLFLSMIQLNQQRQLKRESATSNQKYLKLKELDRQLFQLQTRHQHTSHEANLFCYVQCEIPSSRVIAEVVNRLPKTCVLEKLKITFEKKSPSQLQATTNRRGPRTVQTDDDKLLSPAQRDLKNLVQEKSEYQRVVNIEGSTTAPTELHRFVEMLAHAGVFVSADLRLLDSSESHESETANFLVRAIVKPLNTLKAEPNNDAVRPNVANVLDNSNPGVER